MTLKALLARVPGSRRHHIDPAVDQGVLSPPPSVDESNRRVYVEAHVDQLAAYVSRVRAKRARRDAKRAMRRSK